MANQTFQCPKQCGYSDSAHRILKGCNPNAGKPNPVVPPEAAAIDELETKADKAAREMSSVLLAAGAIAEENDRLRKRLEVAMGYTVKALTEESRNRSLAYSRKALASMRGIGES